MLINVKCSYSVKNTVTMDEMVLGRIFLTKTKEKEFLIGIKEISTYNIIYI